MCRLGVELSTFVTGWSTWAAASAEAGRCGASVSLLKVARCQVISGFGGLVVRSAYREQSAWAGLWVPGRGPETDAPRAGHPSVPSPWVPQR
jgi:O-glycosyl hydrolase